MDFNLHVPADALVAVTLLALLSSHLRFATERYWHKSAAAGEMLATLVLAAGMSLPGLAGIPAGRRGRVAGPGRPDSRVDSPIRRQGAPSRLACEPMNFVTAYQMGECFRAPGFADPTNGPALLETAMHWYQRSEKLNPHSYCLVATWQHAWFFWATRRSRTLLRPGRPDDPNGYYTAANMGWHYLEERNYTAARIWLRRSLALRALDNPIAAQCLTVVEQELSINAGDLDARGIFGNSWKP